ncbi:MAG TPA: hypothetical protein PLS00_18175 [Niabella sp.]|jgi:hypothetical protein|nr:hypothetical protein [Niabella sp.]
MNLLKKFISLIRVNKKNEKTGTFKFEVFGKEYSKTINVTPPQLDEAIKNYYESDEFKQQEKEFDKKQKRIDDKKTQFDVEYSISTTLKALYDIENSRYFTIQKHIDKISQNCNEISKHFKDGLYEKHKKGGIKKFAKDYDVLDVIPQSSHVFLENPKAFKANLKKFHKVELLKSVDIIYSYWIEKVSALKQKAAKIKRQQYVIDGFEVLKSELISLKPSTAELQKVDNIIDKIKSENWSLL